MTDIHDNMDLLSKHAAGKLTLKALMALPVGGFLASGVADRLGTPKMAEPVAPLNGRNAQWERAKKLGAAQKNFFHFTDKATYAAAFAQAISASKSHPLRKMP